jgi:hypothetical protein
MSLDEAQCLTRSIIESGETDHDRLLSMILGHSVTNKLMLRPKTQTSTQLVGEMNDNVSEMSLT